uniref:Cystinosin n=1 Tax=Globodera rostochiensis TaxID=31243 RepID=A0A914HY55_GLORO
MRFTFFLSTLLITIGQLECNFHDHLKISKDLPIQCPNELTVSIGHEVPFVFLYTETLEHSLSLVLNTRNNSRAQVNVTGLSLSSRTYIEVQNCSLVLDNGTFVERCPFDSKDLFVPVAVVKSKVISVLIIITGWVYFLAWSISFYPQIVLNFQRKSVIGLNFDFLLLNVIGFCCYTVYNVMLYFDQHVQAWPAQSNSACIITGLQCFVYERGTQRISYIGRSWASLLLCFSFVSLALALFHVLNWLDFINYLSYTKLAVTLSKYLPQAILNFKRKSTVGWSIGNVLLDFSGGFMDICQMCLQATNTNDWSAFTGNPVKFGLGIVSMLFDILFITQHYVLYRAKVNSSYNRVEGTDANAAILPTPPAPSTAASPVGYNPQFANEAEPIILPETTDR